MSLARSTHHHVLDLPLLHPTPFQLGLWVSPCMHKARPSWTSGDDSRALWNILLNISLSRCSVTLGCSGTLHHLQQHFILVRLRLDMLFCRGSWGPNPWLFCFLHVHLARVSSTTSNDFQCQLLPQNHGCRILDVTSIRNTQASR